MIILWDALAALWEAGGAARNQRTMFLAAGLSYFAVFSLIPAVLGLGTVMGFVVGETVSSREVVLALTHWVGSAPAEALVQALGTARPGAGAGIVSLVAVLLAGSVVFYQLRRILNVMWGVPRGSVRHEVVGRTVAFLMVLLMGGVMTATLGVHAALGGVRHLWGRYMPELAPRLWTGLDEAALYAAFAGLIALMFKLLPSVSPPWRHVFVGAVVTAGLITGVNHLLGLYFNHSLLSGLYGAAAGFMVVLLWVYLSAEVFLFGAAFTGCYAARRGWRPGPATAKDKKEPHLYAQEKA